MTRPRHSNGHSKTANSFDVFAPGTDPQELRIATIAALSQQIRTGESRHGLYNKRDLYERGHVAQCSRAQAIAITVFIFTAIFLTSLVAAFVRPFNNCEDEDSFLEEIPPDEVVESLIATDGSDFPWDDIRLPTFIKPIRYDIELTPNLTTLWVKGIEKIIFTVTEETNFIVFHSKNITITSRTINERLQVEQMLEYPNREQIYFETDDYMKPGITYAIRIKFQYKLVEALEGFYLSTYTDKDGTKRRLATSHFEPTYARHAFPCFDEPQLKAKVLMTIIHDKGLVAFFNTPKRESLEIHGKPNWVRDEFKETVDMSTYLIAFVVCDFDHVSGVTKNNVTVSVIASKEKIQQANFALKAAINIMDYYDEFFGVKYPLPKQDLIAIPDFGAGAMENWGLITYRETSLLYSEAETSADAKQWIAVVVAHELAHQWFGNLVTMKWWNDLWLNEGFASWMEYRGVDHIQPDWQMMDQFFYDMIVPALGLDSLSTSHPVSVPVKDPKEIEAIFDTISYKKGAAIIHMLEDFVGETTLREGLTTYLKRHEFGNAVTNDLWEAISDSWNGSYHNISVREMMDTWTIQMGYPLITFDRINETNIYEIKQERFVTVLMEPDDDDNDEDSEDYVVDDNDYTWVVPVSFMTDIQNAENQFDSVVLNKTHELEFEFPADTKWFKGNLNGTGFYRVMYPLENWYSLVEQLKENHKVFTPADRAQLINDAFGLTEASLLPASIPLEMCTYLIREDEMVPWATALHQLTHWKTVLQETATVPLINKFIASLISRIYEDIGWEDEGSDAKRLLRKLIIQNAVSAEIAEAEVKAKEYFTALIDKGKAVPPNLRWVVYSTGVKFGGVRAWKFAWNKYNRTLVPSEKSLWMRALTYSAEPYILQQYLQRTLDRSQIRLQDVRSVLGGVADNPSGSLLAWRHVQLHWKEIQKDFGQGSFIIGSIIEYTTDHFSTEFDYDQVRRFFRRRSVGSGLRSLKQSLERIKINIEFRKEQEANIDEWLRNKLGEN